MIDRFEDPDGIQWNVLRRDVEPRCQPGTPIVPESSDDLGIVAFPGEVQEDDRLESIVIRHRVDGFHRFVIREVAMTAGDPLLEEWRSARSGLEDRVVVRFETDEVTSGEEVADLRRDAADVGRPSDGLGDGPRVESESEHGRPVVVMRSEGDGHVQKSFDHGCPPAAIGERQKLSPGNAVPSEGRVMARGREHRPAARFQRASPGRANVIGVGMRDHDGSNMVEVDVGGVRVEAPGKGSGTDTQIDADMDGPRIVTSSNGKDGEVST